jgi:PAS domain S-box-containing protein
VKIHQSSEELYKSLIENIDLGITLIDTNYKIVMTNAAQGRLFKKPISKFVGKYCFREFERRSAICSHCPGTKSMETRRPHSVYTEGVCDDGSRFSAKIHTFPVIDKLGEVKGFIEVVEDITERKKIEKELKTAADEWQVTFDSTIDLIMLLDNEMRIIKANFATTKFLSRPFNEILGKNCFQLFHGTDRPPAVCPVKKMKMTKKHEEAELYLSEKDIWIRISSDPVFDDKDNLITSVHIIRNITERKQTEEKLQAYQEQLRSLASQLSLVEERERRRIAINLHDHISQTLAVSKIKLGALREFVSSSFLTEYVDEIRKLIEQIIQYTRSLTFELSPPILYDLGFEAAVEWLGEQILTQHGILFKFKDDGQPKLIDDEARILLYQAVRELLVNVAKHSHARNSMVSIRRDGDIMRITVEDDGVGFDASEIDSYLRTGCFGFFSIRERLNRIGGCLDIKSEPGHRTRIIIVAPLKPQKM